jgi:hypothetical protein
MTDAEYQELLDALARKHLRFRTIRQRIETEEIAFLIERLSATSRLRRLPIDRGRKICATRLRRNCVTPL